MSRHGNKATNRANTRKQILRPSGPMNGKNWLGIRAGTGAAQACDMLIEGATMSQMLRATSRRTEASVMACINPLRSEWGLPIIRDEAGRWKYDRVALGLDDSPDADQSNDERETEPVKIATTDPIAPQREALGKEAARQRLIHLLRQLSPEMQDKLSMLKEERKQLERPDFIWHFLLQSFATMGNSRGWYGLIGNPANYNRVTFSALAPLDKRQRHQILLKVLTDARVRMSEKKANWLDANYDLINEMGGLEESKRQALAQSGTEAKIAFMQRFHGIGDKYSRNMWMDVYHPDFHDTIAVDERIKAVTRALGYAFASYAEHERFYQQIAHESDLQGWELDRLLYNYRDVFLTQLQAERPTQGYNHFL